MLKVCEGCEYRKSCSYEELVEICGRCREVKKADMVDHAEPQDPFKGNRWTKGKQSLIDSNTRKVIKKLYNEGMSQNKIGSLFGYSQKTISNILRSE